MRTRVLPFGPSSTSIYRKVWLISSGTITWQATSLCTATRNYGRIIDDPERKYSVLTGGLRLQQMKPVSHEMWSLSLHGKTVSLPLNADVWALGSGDLQMQETGFAIPTTDLGFTLASDLKSRIPACGVGHYDRWQRVKPGMSTRANMAVFLYELRDLTRMFDLLPKRHLTKMRSWSDVRQWLAYGNGLHLNFNFGWKPFVKDLERVFRGMATFDTRLVRFLNQAGKDLIRHATDATDVKYSDVVPHPNYPNTWHTIRTIEGQLVHSSTFWYDYVNPYREDEFPMWRAVLDTIGLKANPANVWAVIPWSFVIDWFSGLSSHLDPFTDDWIAPAVNWHDAYASRRFEGTGRWDCLHVPSGVTCPGPVMRMKMYDRHWSMPRFQASDPGTLDADKIRLLASLVGGRLL